ncbi:Ig-like domain-containing protein [Salmonella enterica]|nr:Ig-like domain-containing protein [Salmonella enterica]
MINFKPKIPAMLGALAVLTAGAAHAELLEYTFKAPDGTQRSLTPNANYANPTGNISFALSAGIDRKVKISVLRSDGTVVSTATSHLLGATDRITVGGKSYYGAELQLPAPVGGAYTIRAEILASDGSTVQTDEYPLTVDVTPPTYSSLAPVYSNYGQVTSGDVWKLGLGGSEDNAFLLSGISDESPIKGVKAKLYRQDGSLYKDVSVNYDDANGQARQSFQSGFFPASDLDEVFTLQFEISDSAGNSYLSPRQKVMFDSITNAPSAPFGVYDPSSTNNLGPGLTGFVAYTEGMTVKTNPIKLAWRVPRDNWHEYREGGINMTNALGEMSKVGEDASYVYLVTTAPYGNTDGNYWRWVNFGQWGGGGIAYNLTLSPSAPKSPRLLGVDYNYSDIGWSSFYRYWVNNSVLPVTVSSIRVKVEPRPYVQTAVHRGSCEIPVGQDSCVIANSFTMAKGTTGYVHDNATVFNPDKSLRSNPLWAEVNWNDQHYPQLSQQFDQNSKVFTLFVNQPGRGAYFDRLRLRSAWIEDSKGNKLSPTGGLIANNWENYTYQWDLKTLPEGQYSLVAAAEEMHGPLTRQPMFQITSDRTPPTMTLSVADGAAIQTLDDVVITLADAIDPSPKLTSIALVGGPANDKVQLSWREESKGRFRLEYPVMFPSLKEGESYTLTVSGEDAQGNAVQKAVGFEYKPRQVMLADGMDGKVMVPAVTHEFVHADGKRIIETKPLTLSDGAVVTGSYDVFATLRSLDDRQDLRATGQVVWETSKDDGKTWEQFIPEDRYKYQLVKTFDKGEYQVRAKVVNVNSGAEKYTEAVSVVAYDKPDIAVIGPTTLFVGSEGKYTANLTLNDEPISGGNAIVEWSTDGGKTYAQTGDSITLSSDEETRYRLWARVRSATAPADDGYAYEVAKTAVDFRAVKAPRPYVTGPRVIETGKKYVFKAETSLPYRGMDVKLNGFFTLPDGSIVQGDTAEYEPSDTDLNQATVETKYTTWIEGYRDQGAEASHSLRSRVWQYVWPSFGMQVRKNADVAPATITASVRPIAFNGKLEEPTYEWELPEGAVIQDQRQDIVRSFVINEPGDYNIKVTVRDARGHETVIEQPLKIGQAAPYAIDLQYSGSNKYEREPLDVLLRPYISGGHPRDRISTRVYSVDGTPLESSGYYGRATLGAGEHSIKLKITSEMGHEAEGEVNINVAENKLPACSLSSRETVGSWIVYANCEDTDGRMKSYEWTIAGELQSISSDRVTISKGTYETMPTISLVGVDDSGGKSEAVTMN